MQWRIIMSADPVADYQHAIADVRAAKSRATATVERVRALCRALGEKDDWKQVGIEPWPISASVKRRVDGIPSAAELRETLADWHAAVEEMRSCWLRLENKTGLTEPGNIEAE